MENTLRERASAKSRSDRKKSQTDLLVSFTIGRCLGGPSCNQRPIKLGYCDRCWIMYGLSGSTYFSQAPMLYAIQALDGVSAVKFGTALDPNQRLKTLLTGSPINLELIGAVISSRKIERLVHKLLHKHHIRGEWFRVEGEAKELSDVLATNDVKKFFSWMDKICDS